MRPSSAKTYGTRYGGTPRSAGDKYSTQTWGRSIFCGRYILVHTLASICTTVGTRMLYVVITNNNLNELIFANLAFRNGKTFKYSFTTLQIDDDLKIK